MNQVSLDPLIEGYLDYQSKVRRLAPRSVVDNPAGHGQDVAAQLRDASDGSGRGPGGDCFVDGTSFRARDRRLSSCVAWSA